MSFSSEVRDEIKNKYFTFKNRHSKMAANKEAEDKRVYLMEQFLNCGSMSDPEKFYHLEFVCGSEDQASRVCRALEQFSIRAGHTLRKEQHIVYIKDSEGISDLLTVLGAHNAVLRLENVRVLREISGGIQRRVNFETANIIKSTDASVRQVEEIRLIESKIGLKALPDNLREVAVLRLEHPDATLQELAELSAGGISKSGINHRLRKLGRMAEDLKTNETPG